MKDPASTEPMLASGGSVSAIAQATPHLHYKNVYKRKTLRAAWRIVHSNGVSSKNEETRRQIAEFSVGIESHLERLYRQLKNERFKFPLAEGVLIAKKGKKPRPIVRSPIPTRIVQRAILEVLQADPVLEPYYKNPASFGGIKGKHLGVRGAMRAVYAAIRPTNGAKYFIRSDINSFFTKIPRMTVLDKICAVIPDPKFHDIVRKATHVELDNLASLGTSADRFPSYEIGVAQGCCLSPLLGNILLERFDRELNGRNIICIRYIDDFIVLGPTEAKVEAAFRNGLRLLAEHDLTAYDPIAGSDKAEMGEVKHGFEFLGCEVRPGMIGPARKSRQRIIEAVKATLDRSQRLMENPRAMMEEDLGAVATLEDANNILQGWGNQYAFCNDREVFKMLDTKVNGMIEAYWRAVVRRYAKFAEKKDMENARHLLGVHLLGDSKFDPIVDPLSSESCRS